MKRYSNKRRVTCSARKKQRLLPLNHGWSICKDLFPTKDLRLTIQTSTPPKTNMDTQNSWFGKGGSGFKHGPFFGVSLLKFSRSVNFHHSDFLLFFFRRGYETLRKRIPGSGVDPWWWWYMSVSIRGGDPSNGNIPLLVVSQLDANTYRCFQKVGVGTRKWMIYNGKPN